MFSVFDFSWDANPASENQRSKQKKRKSSSEEPTQRKKRRISEPTAGSNTNRNKQARGENKKRTEEEQRSTERAEIIWISSSDEKEQKSNKDTDIIWIHSSGESQLNEGITADASKEDVKNNSSKQRKRRVSCEELTPRKRMRISEQTESSDTDENTQVGREEMVIKDDKQSSDEERWLMMSDNDELQDEMSRLVEEVKADVFEQQTDQNLTEFQAKYEQLERLGEGGFGCVFSGYRKADNLPVAIKHIKTNKVFCKYKEINSEVLAMEKLAKNTSETAGASAPVSLLDWYDVGDEMILVLERPVPSTDLSNYVDSKGSLPEDEAKIVIKQLVNALIHLENESIFHRDIKMENILIETGSDVPRVRIIDFGLCVFTGKYKPHQAFCGTCIHIPPEYYSYKMYQAGPTTVWQIGIVLYDILHWDIDQFLTQRFLQCKLNVKSHLSDQCKDFLSSCLVTDPKYRPTLEDLLLHPWLK